MSKPFIFMEFQILAKTEFINKQNYVKKIKKVGMSSFCEPGNFLGNKIQFFMCKMEIVPTSCGNSEN